ncbi:hypothetical protein CLOSTMETH_02085 [[Clostridium] methylpentosum DSM 5476]|uniref:Uncharacterized protein n=1 Tax=[Clostridium] methylpentosum DSM 5476 TaxID=537013 RepID=C0EE06_9FIRM|nr:hypothetical protein CLOSTMETH_02085 [[Clostridium] methylpentosum DSM 5476]
MTGYSDAVTTPFLFYISCFLLRLFSSPVLRGRIRRKQKKQGTTIWLSPAF